MNMNTDKGILYVATADKFLDEAIVSAKSVKKCMPDLPIVMFTHDDEFKSEYFDEVRIINNYTNLNCDKIDPILSSPFEKTLFIDTDTYFCESVLDVFDLLDNFDLAITHAFHRRPFQVKECPDCFPELNGGVIFFKKSTQIIEFFERWKSQYKYFYETRQIKKDQPSLRYCLYHSPIRFYVLPPEFNLRPQFPSIMGKGETVKVLHTRGHNFEEWKNRLNESFNRLRVSIPSWEYFEDDRLIIMKGDRVSSLIKKVLSFLRLIRGNKMKHF